MGGPCDFSVSPSPFGLDFGTLDFGTSDSGLTKVQISNFTEVKSLNRGLNIFSRPVIRINLIAEIIVQRQHAGMAASLQRPADPGSGACSRATLHCSADDERAERRMV